MPFAIAVLVAGPITTMIGYYTPVMVIGTVLMVIGTGLYTTFSPTTPPPEWISYQILYGLGVGLAFQQPFIAVQTVLPESAISSALVAIFFTQQIGGIVALSIAQNMFTSRLTRELAKEVPGLDPSTILSNGALGIMKTIPEQYVGQVKGVYNDAIVDVYYLALALTCTTVVAALCIEWRSVKEKANRKDQQEISLQMGEQTIEEEGRQADLLPIAARL